MGLVPRTLSGGQDACATCFAPRDLHRIGFRSSVVKAGERVGNPGAVHAAVLLTRGVVSVPAASAIGPVVRGSPRNRSSATSLWPVY